jgi:pimeloyl-ACP methyl ester carboxylesterase
MEPRIQYATASDGVRIAFSVVGKGLPYVLMPTLPWSHIERMWKIPIIRRMLERSAEKRQIVQYDNRGSGLSERGIGDFSLEAHLMDLHAVVDHLGLERFDLSARQHSGPVAITYAARNPDRVSHLVLVNTYARASDYFSSQQQAVHELAEKDWGLFTETAARFGLGWNDEEMAKVLASLFRESVSQDVAVATYRAIVEFDTSSLLAQVSVPTSVVHAREFRYLDLEVSKGIAARIPGARLSIVEGSEARIGELELLEHPAATSPAITTMPSALGLANLLAIWPKGYQRSRALASQSDDYSAYSRLRCRFRELDAAAQIT